MCFWISSADEKLKTKSLTEYNFQMKMSDDIFQSLSFFEIEKIGDLAICIYVKLPIYCRYIFNLHEWKPIKKKRRKKKEINAWTDN